MNLEEQIDMALMKREAARMHMERRTALRIAARAKLPRDVVGAVRRDVLETCAMWRMLRRELRSAVQS